jgi:hypothetical protein
MDGRDAGECAFCESPVRARAGYSREELREIGNRTLALIRKLTGVN